MSDIGDRLLSILNGGGSTATQAPPVMGPPAPAPGGEPVDYDTAVDQLAQTVGAQRDWIEKAVNFESGANPAARNPISGARGLIQFTHRTAKRLGYRNADDLVKQHPTLESQLTGPVANYLAEQGPFKDARDLYLSIFYPAGRDQSDDTILPERIRRQNPGIRTVGDYVRKVEQAYGGRSVAPAPAGGNGGSASTGDIGDRLLALLEPQPPEGKRPELKPENLFPTPAATTAQPSQDVSQVTPAPHEPVGTTRTFGDDTNIVSEGRDLASVVSAGASRGMQSLGNLIRGAQKLTGGTPVPWLETAIPALEPTQEELDAIQRHGLTGKVAADAAALLVQIPAFNVATGAGKLGVNKLVTAVGLANLPKIMPVLSKVAPAVYGAIKTAVSDALGFAGYGAAEAVGAGEEGGQVAKAAASNAVMGGAGGLSGSLTKLLPEATPFLVKKVSQVLASSGGFAAGTKLTGGESEDVLAAAVLGGILPLTHLPESRRQEVNTAADRLIAESNRESGAEVPAGYTGPERRVNTEQRKTIDEMSPEEMKKALAQDELTGLGSRRAFEDMPEKGPYYAMVDADALKWFNDNMGYTAGDQLLQFQAHALREAGVDGYRANPRGDEVIATAKSEKDLAQKLEKAYNILQNCSITSTTPNGEILTAPKLGFSFGIGQGATVEEGLANATEKLHAAKSERERSGLRSPRGEPPPALVRISPRGKQTDASLAGEGGYIPGRNQPEASQLLPGATAGGRTAGGAQEHDRQRILPGGTETPRPEDAANVRRDNLGRRETAGEGTPGGGPDELAEFADQPAATGPTEGKYDLLFKHIGVKALAEGKNPHDAIGAVIRGEAPVPENAPFEVSSAIEDFRADLKAQEGAAPGVLERVNRENDLAAMKESGAITPEERHTRALQMALDARDAVDYPAVRDMLNGGDIGPDTPLRKHFETAAGNINADPDLLADAKVLIPDVADRGFVQGDDLVNFIRGGGDQAGNVTPGQVRKAQNTKSLAQARADKAAGLGIRRTPRPVVEQGNLLEAAGINPKADLVAAELKRREAEKPPQEEVNDLPLFTRMGEGKDYEEIPIPGLSPESTTPEGKVGAMRRELTPLTAGGISMEQAADMFGGEGKGPKYAGSINLRRIDAGFEPKKILLETEANFHGSINEARRGKVSVEQTNKEAAEFGLTPRELLRRRRGEGWGPAKTQAARQLHVNTLSEFWKITQEMNAKRAAGTLTPRDQATWELAERKYAAVLAETSGLATEAGRTLRQHRQAVRAVESVPGMREWLTTEEPGGGAAESPPTGTEVRPDAEQQHMALPSAKEMQGLVDKLQGDGLTTEQKIEAIASSMGDAGKIAKMIRRGSAKSWPRTAFTEFILSGIPTHVSNVTSTVANIVKQSLVDRPLNAAVEAVRKGKDRQVFFGEVPADLVGMYRGFGPAVKEFRHALFAGHAQEGKALTRAGRAGKEEFSAAEKIEGVRPTRWLAAADGFMKTISQSGWIHSLAYRQARIDGLKPGTKEFNDRAAEIIADPDLYPEIWNRALKESKVETFTDRPGSINKTLLQVRKTFEKAGSYYIVPFLNTPMKILKAGLRETPGIGSAMALHKLVKGEGGEKLTREEQNEEIGKIITSNLIAVPLVMLARAGFITGSGPKENDKRAALQETGWQAFSVKVGDRYISYARLEPFATPMGLVADFANIDWTKVKDKPEDVAWDVARSIQKNVTNKTFFEQLDNILSMFDEGGPAMERFAKRFLGSAIPNIVGRATSITDPNYRETRGLPAYMQGRVPGLSNALPPQRGLWGQERKKETGPVGFISPFMVSHVKNDPASIEVARLKLGFPRPDREIRGVKLTPAQYDDYAKTAGEMAHERVMRIIENPKYASLSDETKTEVLRGAVNESRANARNIIWTTHKLKPSETP